MTDETECPGVFTDSLLPCDTCHAPRTPMGRKPSSAVDVVRRELRGNRGPLEHLSGLRRVAKVDLQLVFRKVSHDPRTGEEGQDLEGSCCT